jgi:hypothetical protein
LPESVLDKRLRLGYRAINKIWKVSEANMYYGARGIVGLVKPTYRPGSMESFIKLMPEGVGFIPAHVWATKKILHLNEPVMGYGRLLAEMP